MAVRSIRRQTLLILALCAAAFVLPSRTVATTRAAPSIVQLLDQSDVIVAGVMPETDSGAYTIQVSSYLRGHGPRRIETTIYGDAEGCCDRAFPFDEPGVFFLKRKGGVLAPTGWKAFERNRSYVQSLIHIARDPGPFLSSPRWRSNPDVIDLIGKRFASLKITSTSAPGLAEWLASWRVDPFPWSMTGRREITLTREDATPSRLKGDGTEAGDLLAAILNHNFSDWRGVFERAEPPTQLTVTFDTRHPARWGSLGVGGALQVLDEAVRSRDSWHVTPAIWALSQLRATDAVPQVIARLDHPDRDVVYAAMHVLRRSRDPRAVRALIAFLDRGAEPGPMEDAARTLTCIGGEAALPVFRIRAGHVENARYGLGAFGTLDDITKLMEDTPGALQYGHAALVAARARTNAVSDTWHNSGLVDRHLEARLWREWWARNQDTLRIVSPPTAGFRLNCYE